MLNIEQFRELITNADKYTDEEITRMRDDMGKLADIFFDQWLTKRNKKTPTHDEH